ncbi:4563_t:CDS:2 [Ambispora gerdemannii]|uniref:4563_t:CDS:1 n=1 Tax=Ambispora gerdemannii TaxID=144530 RepID=A0A9N8YXS5_9GLOM|nr:4563_t:CDS:2 [Ambispora gerdemannii]
MFENRDLTDEEIEDLNNEESDDELDSIRLQSDECRAETRIINKKCFDCGNFKTNFAWCQSCETTWFKEKYSSWTTDSVAITFGISKDPDGSFIVVMRFYVNGDLNHYIKNVKVISWKDKIDLLWRITTGLEVIHRSNLYHGNLHGGNIMIEDELISAGRIADIGIHGSKSASQETHKDASYTSRFFDFPDLRGKFGLELLHSNLNNTDTSL